MKPTLRSPVGVFSTAVVAGLVAGVAHQPVEASDKGAKPYTTWSDYAGSPDSAQNSALTQINKSARRYPAVYEVNGREYLAFSARPSLKHLGPDGERATVEASPGAPETQGFYVFALPEPAHK
jgi:hypothetical protein